MAELSETQPCEAIMKRASFSVVSIISQLQLQANWQTVLSLLASELQPIRSTEQSGFRDGRAA